MTTNELATKMEKNEIDVKELKDKLVKFEEKYNFYKKLVIWASPIIGVILLAFFTEFITWRAEKAVDEPLKKEVEKQVLAKVPPEVEKRVAAQTEDKLGEVTNNAKIQIANMAKAAALDMALIDGAKLKIQEMNISSAIVSRQGELNEYRVDGDQRVANEKMLELSGKGGMFFITFQPSGEPNNVKTILLLVANRSSGGGRIDNNVFHAMTGNTNAGDFFYGLDVVPVEGADKTKYRISVRLVWDKRANPPPVSWTIRGIAE